MALNNLTRAKFCQRSEAVGLANTDTLGRAARIVRVRRNHSDGCPEWQSREEGRVGWIRVKAPATRKIDTYRRAEELLKINDPTTIQRLTAWIDELKQRLQKRLDARRSQRRYVYKGSARFDNRGVSNLGRL
jgi:hypothetical protein